MRGVTLLLSLFLLCSCGDDDKCKGDSCHNEAKPHDDKDDHDAPSATSVKLARPGELERAPRAGAVPADLRPPR